MDKDITLNDVNNLIEDVQKLIEVSRFFMYDSEDTYKEHLKALMKLKRNLEKGKFDQVLKNGGEEFDDS